MSAALQPLPAPPSGFRYYGKPKDVLRCADMLAYQHIVLKAWADLKLSGVLTLNGVPTVYISDSKKPLPPSEVAERQLKFWNQGLATVLLLRDPQNVRVFSSMRKPLDPAKADNEGIKSMLVESLGMATQAAWAGQFYLQVGTGHYYNKPEHREKFDPAATVDAYLLNNLEKVRDELVSGKNALSAPMAHAFLGRILFTCYLCHRGIIKLENYLKGTTATDVLELLTSTAAETATTLLYGQLFPKLKREFNSSMFDDELDAESTAIKPRHIEAIRHFLEGSEVATGQRTLDFAAYKFAYIPVETISSVYEKFLDHEDETGKRELGAFYTPRLLAEMTLDLALKDRPQLSNLRFLDPSCGSGIFLVLVFNRLVAEWRRGAKKDLTIPEQADALMERLGRLRGVDRNLTACRITCFSLYLAFLDQFDPADVRQYVAETGHKLPNLLDSPKIKKPTIPVVWHRDFTELDSTWQEPFDVVVGNPPWVGRGSKQIAHQFMELAPKFLKPDGTATLILPTKIFFNKTDAFQKQWLEQVTLETVIQLADYRFILFKGAICPSVIARFKPQPPEADHAVEFIAPKVTLTDLRDGLIAVGAQDRKWIPLQTLLGAAEQGAIGMAWKTYLWATPRDRKLLSYLFTLPRLGEIAGSPAQVKRGEKRWSKGQGFQPVEQGKDSDNPSRFEWNWDERIITPKNLEGLACFPGELCATLKQHFGERGYRTDILHRPRHEDIYLPPLVLVNQGFSSSAFVDYPVRFQHALQSFAGPEEDGALLQLLSLFFTSKLARYFAFHTSANIGTERDKMHLDEVLRLPFFPPESAPNPDAAKQALKTISSRFQSYMDAAKKAGAKLTARLEKVKNSHGPLFDTDGDNTVGELKKAWRTEQQAATESLRQELEPHIYAYFGLTGQEIALVEDTCDIFDRSDTPGSLASAANTPTLQPIKSAEGLKEYADQICRVLNDRIVSGVHIRAAGMVDPKTGLALIEFTQSKTEVEFKALTGFERVAEAADTMQKATAERLGTTLEFHRTGWFFEGKKIYILKPARRGEWTRTAAILDAAEIYESIQSARRAATA